MFLSGNVISETLIDKNKLNYIDSNDGYLGEVTKKNSALMYESIKRGVKVFSQKDADKQDAYDPNIVYPPPHKVKSKEELEKLHKKIKKYNKILEEYYFEVLNEMNSLQTAVNESDSGSSDIKKKLAVIKKLFDTVVKTENTDDIKAKEDIIKILKKYSNLKRRNRDYINYLKEKLSDYAVK